MYSNLKAVFDDELKDLVLNRSFMNNLKMFAKRFMTKNQEHIKFFGDALIGAHKLTWGVEDRNELFDDVFDMADYHSIRDNINSLKSINPAFKVSSDPMNNVVMYLVAKLHTNKQLSASENQECQALLLHVMHYRFICSLQNHYFPHQADIGVSRQAFSELSNKFDLKVQGSWQRWIDGRAQDILRKDGLHYKLITQYSSDDNDIIKMINDIQGRIRQMYKNIYAVWHKVYEEKNKIHSTSQMMEGEDGLELKDQSNGFLRYKRYIVEIVPEQASFIRRELVSVVTGMCRSMPSEAFMESLMYISDNYQTSRAKYLEPIVEETVVHALNYLVSNKIPANDLRTVLTRLSASYSSSRTEDQLLLGIKESLGKEMRLFLPNNRHSAIPSIRTGVMLYIVLRTLTMKHYSA